MTRHTLTRILTLGALSGVRSMAGLTTLAIPSSDRLRTGLLLLSAGEMVADKTSLVGDRTDALPLVGRAACGALVGALVASERDDSLAVGALIGAGAAIAATHLAFQWRTRLAPSGMAGGLIEDALVLAVAARHT